MSPFVFYELSYAAPEYEIIQINIPGSESTRARAINDKAEVVGNFFNNSTGYAAFYWENGKSQILDKSNGFSDINNKSQIVGSLYGETSGEYVPINDRLSHIPSGLLIFSWAYWMGFIDVKLKMQVLF